jgi:hypothetical protein
MGHTVMDFPRVPEPKAIIENFSVVVIIGAIGLNSIVTLVDPPSFWDSIFERPFVHDRHDRLNLSAAAVLMQNFLVQIQESGRDVFQVDE